MSYSGSWLSSLLDAFFELDAENYHVVAKHPALVNFLERDIEDQLFLAGLPWIAVFAVSYVIVVVLCRGDYSVVVNFVAFLHALVSTAGAAYALFAKAAAVTCITSRISVDYLVVALSAGYFWSHAIMYLIVPVHPRPKNWQPPSDDSAVIAPLVAHHVGCFILFYSLLQFNRGVPICAYFLFTEASTPFLCIGEELNRTRNVDGIAFIINGALLVATFVLCRVLYQPWLLYEIFYKQYCLDVIEGREWYALYWGYVVVIGLYYLNVTWCKVCVDKVGTSIKAYRAKKTN